MKRVRVYYFLGAGLYFNGLSMLTNAYATWTHGTGWALRILSWTFALSGMAFVVSAGLLLKKMSRMMDNPDHK